MKFHYIFNDKNHSKWLNITHEKDNTLQINITDHVRYKFTTMYEFEIVATFEGKSYTDTAKLNLLK